MQTEKQKAFFSVSYLIIICAISVLPMHAIAGSRTGIFLIDDFDRPDSFYCGSGWESLNPGYWKIQKKALRRRLHTYGEGAHATGFPYHWETHSGKPMRVEYDPSLPFGMIWRRDWKLSGNYTIRIDATVKALRPEPVPGDNPSFRMYKSGYALMGICFGSRSLYESWYGLDRYVSYGSRIITPFFKWHGKVNSDVASWMAAWRDNATFGIYDHASDKPKLAQKNAEKTAPALKSDDKVTIELTVSGKEKKTATVTAKLISDSSVKTVKCTNVDRKKYTEGYFGLVARGLLDFEVNRVMLEPNDNKPLDTPVNELHVCYALGDTLRKTDNHWRCKFVALFRSFGKKAEIRISDSLSPVGGWESVSVAGSASIINNDFRRNTAVIDATLPSSPAEKTMYYTVWKDGKNVTADPRLGTDSVGRGTGFLGTVPENGQYVGRLPQLKAPYRLCGLGGHMIDGGYRTTTLSKNEAFEENYIHDQPMPDAFKHIEEYEFQVMLWEDDIWYLEVTIFPPSIDDAYKIITTTIAGPTQRWMMMRHWNVLNPGDHDFGMDDIKGPEQYVIRNQEGLGQDPEYMRRNRGAADFAGWVKAGADRVIELFSSRKGVTTVYGDIHLASILFNLKHRFYECSFGPVASCGSRGVKPGFGPKMTDYDGRPVRIYALYHNRYRSPDLKPLKDQRHWNFLEMQFNSKGKDPTFSLKIRNLIDSPKETPRGGGKVSDHASNTGRDYTCKLPQIKTLPNADVLFTKKDGQAIRGARSLEDGTVPVRGLIDVKPRTQILMTSFDGKRADAQVIQTMPIQ